MEGGMHWIEDLLGLKPDGGDGTTEMMILLVACLTIGLVIYARFIRPRTSIGAKGPNPHS